MNLFLDGPPHTKRPVTDHLSPGVSSGSSVTTRKLDLIPPIATIQAGQSSTHEPPDSVTDIAEWFNSAYAYLTQTHVSSSFDNVLKTFARVEALYGYRQGRNGFSTHGRPPLLSKWVKNGRWRVTKVPRVLNISEFADQWWSWWKNLLNSGSSPAKESGKKHGDMAHLIAPGPNGWLGVVVCLYWWGQTSQLTREVEDRNTVSFEAAVDQVSHTMLALLDDITSSESHRVQNTSA